MSDLPPEPPPPLYRIWLKPAGDRAGIERMCLPKTEVGEGLLGLGWGYHHSKDVVVPADVTFDDWNDWARVFWHGKAAPVTRFREAETGEALVWTRAADGIYYLAKFTGEWEYRGDQDSNDLDLNNVRPARIARVGAENMVPGAVVRSLSRRGGAFSRVWDGEAAHYSALMWAKLTGETYDWEPTPEAILKSLLSPGDVEDLVAAYLQVTRGWVLFPSRLSSSTAAYEYVLIDPATDEQHAVQVKTGTSPRLDLSTLASAGVGLDGWVVFSTEDGILIGDRPDTVEVLQRTDLLDFMATHRRALPPVIRAWLGDDASAR